MTVLYADPPWQYRDRNHTTKNGKPAFYKLEKLYPTLTVEQIMAFTIPVPIVDAVLFLWATVPLLPDALLVMKAWGFTYKSCLVWDKQRRGTGHWFHLQHELLLMGIKGEVPCPIPSVRPRSVLSVRRSKHSEKPFHVRDMITKMFPDANKVEIFARTTWQGWESYGNQLQQLVFT